jgi:lysyl-tRNA synthetase class 2
MIRGARLASSMIESVRFDEDAQELCVCFRGGRTYIYSKVPRPVFEALRSAASAGAYFNRFIRGRFACRSDPPSRFRPS